MRFVLTLIAGLAILGLTACEKVKRDDVPSRSRVVEFGMIDGCKVSIVDTGYQSSATIDGVSIPSGSFWLVRCPTDISRVEWTEKSGKSTVLKGITVIPPTDTEVEAMRKQARERALAKLTPAEREVLGFPPLPICTTTGPAGLPIPCDK